MSTALHVALHELRLLWRSRVALVAIGLVALLAGVSAFVTFSQVRATQETRARLQVQVDQEFDAQPRRHPHRMVHYGHFAFRPVEPLAMFDPGVEAFAGNVIYLEGHRQNSANFADARQSSLLLRFGQLTPAAVLQMLLPLLLIVIGATNVAAERERGGLRLLLSQGASARTVLGGKLLALLAAGALATAPATMAMVVIGSRSAPGPWAAMALGYAMYLVIWAVAVTLLSALATNAGNALRFLLGVWAVVVVMLPRLAPEAATLHAPLESRFETDFAVQRELRAIGDSHDENDPHFASFQQTTLQRFGAARIEDLPVNYKGLLALEGERLTSELFTRHATRVFETQVAQSRVLDGFALLSPLPALRRLSMSAAQSDLASHRNFVAQAERHRYDFVQRLNALQADAVTYADDTGRETDAVRDARTRIDASHWRELPDFSFVADSPASTLRRALPPLGALSAWALVLMGGLLLAASRIERSGR